jgi:GNAT superfamily N-acetyltransferase
MPALPAVKVRSPGPDGIPEAARLVTKILQEELDLRIDDLLAHDAEAARREFDETRDLLLTAEADGRTVGTLLVLHDAPAPAPTAAFRWLVVEGPFRGQGIGRDLFGRALEICRQRSLVRLRARCFASSAAAPHLYWMHGFRVVELLQVTVAGKPRETLLFEKLLEPPHPPLTSPE